MRDEAEQKVEAIEQKRKIEESNLASTSQDQIAIIWRFFDAYREKMGTEWFQRLRDDDGI